MPMAPTALMPNLAPSMETSFKVYVVTLGRRGPAEGDGVSLDLVLGAGGAPAEDGVVAGAPREKRATA